MMRNQRGFSLIELLVAVGVFVVVALGLGSVFITTVRATNQGSATSFLQRQGTLIQEDISREIWGRDIVNKVVGLPVGSCGGAALPESQMVQRNTDTLCFYRNSTNGQIYVCTWTGSACSNPPGRNLLAGSPVAIEATSLQFTPLVLVGINSSIDVAFELRPQDRSAGPISFGMSLTLRN